MQKKENNRFTAFPNNERITNKEESNKLQMIMTRERTRARALNYARKRQQTVRNICTHTHLRTETQAQILLEYVI